MTAPTTDDWNKLVRLGRYLAWYFRVVNWYKYQNVSEKVVTCTDSDWAGCRRTRRSQRPADASTVDRTCSSSGAKAELALSSAEAELGAAVKGESRSSRDDVVVEGRR